MSEQHEEHDLEALSRGQLDAAATRDAERHAASCRACGEELAWLQTEAAVVAGRRATHAPARTELDRLWAGIERETGVASGRRRAAVVGGAVGAALAAAAVLVFVIGTGGEGVTRAPIARAGDAGLGPPRSGAAPAAPDGPAAPGPGPVDPRMADAERAVADAEQAYALALDALEADYRARRGALDPAVAEVYDQSFHQGRRELDAARSSAGGDLDARVLVLDLYATQVKRLRGSLRRLDR